MSGGAPVDWSATMAGLRATFLAGAWERLHSLEKALGRLAADPGDEPALHVARVAFHGFAGSGGSYGLPRLSQLAAEGERACLQALERGAVDTAWQAAARSTVDALRAELAATPLTEDAGGGPGRLPALVVDDDPGLVATLEIALRDEGLAPSAAGSLGEARAALRSGLPAALVVDVMLPDGSGFDLVREVRARAGGTRVAIHVISARSEFLDKVEAVHCGADAFLAKPIDARAVARRVATEARVRVQPPGRVLLVEDDADQAAYVRALLAAAGYDVRICADGTRLEAELAAAPPDVVLMDVLLPGIGGFDLVRYLRQDERYRLLPVLFVTAGEHPGGELAAERAGGDDILTKPVPPAVLLTKVAARIERYRLLQSQLEHDGLTRALTHTALLERTRAALAAVRRDPERPCAWVMVDLDHFKAVNDGYGHAAGDAVLRHLGNLLRRHVRAADLACRTGGEEFTVVLPGSPLSSALERAEAWRAALAAAPVDVEARAIACTMSVGVALLRPESETFEQCWARADGALYVAKQRGRDRVEAAEG